MADDLTIDNGSLTDYDVATDDDGSGNHVQIVKLAQAGDGSRTPIPADSDGMLVNLGTNNDVTNGGTFVVQENGAALTALQIIDDWDESDRAKVNLIAGQAGITAGAGAVAANTPRVTHASDDPVTTAVQLIDDAIVADDAAFTPATTKVMMAGFEFDDTTPDTVNEGDAGAARMSSRREQYMQIRDAAGNERGANVNASNAMLVAQTGALPAGTNNIGDVDVLTLPNVTLAAGTNTNEVVGDAAHGAGVAGNPVLIGLEGRSTDGTAVDSGDVTRPLSTLLGKQVVAPFAIPARTWQYAGVSGGITDTADDAAQAAGGAGVRHYITHVDVVNAHATVGTEVVIKSASTVIWRGYAPAGGGGISAEFPTPLRGGANEAINVTNITTGAATYFNLVGYTAAE